MNPHETGSKYDKIAAWWQAQHQSSNYGVAQLERAIRYSQGRGAALDVGCGSGGRMIDKLLAEGYTVTGIDVSAQMLQLAREQHPEVIFHHADICTWSSDKQYDLILAWDSIFHLPFAQQAPVVAKLCSMLKNGGILLYTFGDAYGSHVSEWHQDNFHYSSIGINENLQLLIDNSCQCQHLEFDQYPENHVYVIAKKVSPAQSIAQ